DDDLLARAKRLLLSLEHIDAAVAGQSRRSFDPVDLVLLEEELDAFRETGDDAILPRLHLTHVDRRRLDAGNAPLLRALDHLERGAFPGAAFGGTPPPQQARPPEPLLPLAHRRFQPELRRADCGNVAAGSGANHDHVIVGGHRWSALSLQ